MDPARIACLLAANDTALAAVAWLILLCTYPDFRCWRSEDFRAHHARYTGRVAWVVAPLMCLQLVGHGHAAANGAGWFGLALCLACWMLTFFWSVPLHRRLQEVGADLDIIRRLTWSHLPRTVLWTVLALWSLRRAVG